MRTVALYGLKREMVSSTLRTCADSTTILATRSDPCARCFRLNHSQAATADSTRRLLIANRDRQFVRQHDSVARLQIVSVQHSPAEDVPCLHPRQNSKKRPDFLDLPKV